MAGLIRTLLEKLYSRARLKPLTMGEKCLRQFGAAVLLVLALALMFPYLWMGKLTEMNALDAGRAVAGTVFEDHFEVTARSEKRLPSLNETGVARDPNDLNVKWFRLKNGDDYWRKDLSARQAETIDELIGDEFQYERGWQESTGKTVHNNYVRIVRATDGCLICHNQKGTAGMFNKSEVIGALVTQIPARDFARTTMMNRIWIVLAGVLAAAGAMVAFYSIAQRIILRPIRQLRALVNNVSEGNLDARSAIKSNDEYERLSDAFNAMLDGLQESQEKLRHANKTLDGKIAQLSDRNIELFKANKLKSEFLTNMSHEVRTPLNAILGFAQLLKERPADNIEKSKRYAENIITSGRALLNMINDLLDLAKAEAGKMQLHLDKASIFAMCQSLVGFFTPMAAQRMIRFEVNIEDDLPMVTTDYGKVQQILYNLLSNAIKFTPDDGSVEISARQLDDQTVRISVKDTGAGIAEEHHTEVFEKFRQVDGSITRQTDGTGLGLAICKELAELVAGQITLESQVGKGSTFHLDIPLILKIESEPQQS
jgi:signal transduction histidine kinase